LRGEGGFGYDPLFLPDGCDRSFAELSPREKNRVSHRARALAELPGLLTRLRQKNGGF
jgi:XTP/dITP diphosphohydrolase